MDHMVHIMPYTVCCTPKAVLRGLCGCGDGSLVVVMGVGWSVCFVSCGRASRIIRDAYLSLVSAVCARHVRTTILCMVHGCKKSLTSSEHWALLSAGLLGVHLYTFSTDLGAL
jgi:hypothetical protein